MTTTAKTSPPSPGATPRERHFTYAEASKDFFAGQISAVTLKRHAGRRATDPRKLNVKRYSSHKVLIPLSELQRWDTCRIAK